MTYRRWKENLSDVLDFVSAQPFADKNNIGCYAVYLSRMIVKPENRNKGIGGIMLGFLIQKAKEMRFSEITLGVDCDNQNAVHLYNKFGFIEVIFEDEDEHGKYMKLLKRI